MILYDNIADIPQHNWEQLNVSGDFKWLIKEGEGDMDPDEVERCYLDLHDQSAEASETTKHFIEEWRRLIIQRMEARMRLAGGDKSAQNNIDIFTHKIEKLLEASKDADIIKNRLKVTKLWGQPINPKEVSHLDYIKIRELVEEEIAQTKKQNNGEG